MAYNISKADFVSATKYQQYQHVRRQPRKGWRAMIEPQIRCWGTLGDGNDVAFLPRLREMRFWRYDREYTGLAQ